MFLKDRNRRERRKALFLSLSLTCLVSMRHDHREAVFPDTGHRLKQRQVGKMRGVAHSSNKSGPIWLRKGSAQRTVGDKTRKVVEVILWQSYYARVRC